jgi:hypothetical protein
MIHWITSVICIVLLDFVGVCFLKESHFNLYEYLVATSLFALFLVILSINRKL